MTPLLLYWNIALYSNLQELGVRFISGVDFKFNGKFDCTQDSIATKARKCTFNLLKKMKDNNLNVETTLSLFGKYVSYVLHYGFAVFGFHKSPRWKNASRIFETNHEH